MEDHVNVKPVPRVAPSVPLTMWKVPLALVKGPLEEYTPVTAFMPDTTVDVTAGPSNSHVLS